MAQIPEKVERTILDFVSEIQKNITVNKIILFGSYARGDFDTLSDVDLAVFSKDFRGKKTVEATTFLLSKTRKYREVCLEPIGFDDTDLIKDNPFVKEILASGKEIISDSE